MRLIKPITKHVQSLDLLVHGILMRLFSRSQSDLLIKWSMLFAWPIMLGKN